jgi:RNA polymerase sigma-70 factor (ECF subfamily)
VADIQVVKNKDLTGQSATLPARRWNSRFLSFEKLRTPPSIWRPDNLRIGVSAEYVANWDGFPIPSAFYPTFLLDAIFSWHHLHAMRSYMGRGIAAMMHDGDPGPEALLQQARAGDGVALGRLLEAYRPYLTLLARMQIGRRLQGKADASDAVQEAFLGAHRDFGQFRGDSERAFLAWLRQVLASVLANLVRHFQGTQRRDVRLEQQLAVELEHSSAALGLPLQAPSSTPSRQAEKREQGVLLAAALERLGREDRELLMLRHLEGLSFPEVARRMGRSLDSVKKRWPRALVRLRQVFEGDEP